MVPILLPRGLCLGKGCPVGPWRATPFSSTRHRLCKVPAASQMDRGSSVCVGGVSSMLLLSSGFVCGFLFFFFAKARGFLVRSWEACGGNGSSRGSGRPQPKVFSARSCPWPTGPSCRLHRPGCWHRHRLLSCLRPLCRSPAPAYSSAAAAGPARPSPARLKSRPCTW